MYFLQGKQFDSIQDLIGYYRKQEVPNKEEISGIYLKHPVLDLKRHRFFDSTFKRQASGDETQSEARNMNSWREKSEKSDRMEHVKLTSQSFPVQTAAHILESGPGNRNPDARTGITSNRSSATDALRSGKNRPFSGYLDLIYQSESTRCASASRPVSQCADTGGGGRRRSSDLDPLLPRDRTLSNQQPVSPSVPWRSLQNRSPPQQQVEAERSVAQSPSCSPTVKAPHQHYSYARSPYTQLAPSLVERLREIEGNDAIKCQCGIYHDDAELPRGWFFHRSTEPETYGRVLFTGPDGQLDWNLPLEVSLELSADQQDKIRDVISRPPPLPCRHLLEATESISRSATRAPVYGGYQTLNSQDT